MKVLDVPCGSCPYRKDVPPGVWDAIEYEKLREYTAEWVVPCLSPFLCHQVHVTGEEALCRGWLTVERDSIAVRLLLIEGRVTREEVYQKVPVALYTSGQEAADAGLAGVEEPAPEAVRMMNSLLKKRLGRFEEREGKQVGSAEEGTERPAATHEDCGS